MSASRGSPFARPFVPVSLMGRAGRRVEALALVDGGADHCVFPLSVAHALGARLVRAAAPSRGIGASPVRLWLGRVSLAVAGFPRYRTGVAFVRDAELPVPLLGQQGFFDRFTAGFQRKRWVFSVSR